MKFVAAEKKNDYTKVHKQKIAGWKAECEDVMKKVSKMVCSMVLTAAVLGGTVLSGCAESTNYTEEIKQYQAKLEALEAENRELKEQLGILETEFPEETGTAETQTESQTAAETETTQESQTEPEVEEQAEASDDGVTRILVLGDSIWGNYRDETGIAAKVEYYMGVMGYKAKVYNAAIGGTRATIDYDDNEWEYGPGSDNSLGKMLSIMEGKTDIELLQGKMAYTDLKEAMEVIDEIDLVILAYGMNDFLSQAPDNNSDRPWTGFGTAMFAGVSDVERICPQAEIMLVAPTYASYFSIPINNYGGSALYNYASLVCDVAKGKETLCIDAYNNMGIDAYTADQYLEDGVHLNEAGRDLYARNVVSCLFGGIKGTVSSNSIIDFDKLAEQE